MPTLISQQTHKYSSNITMQLFRSGSEVVETCAEACPHGRLMQHSFQYLLLLLCIMPDVMSFPRRNMTGARHHGQHV